MIEYSRLEMKFSSDPSTKTLNSIEGDLIMANRNPNQPKSPAKPKGGNKPPTTAQTTSTPKKKKPGKK